MFNLIVLSVDWQVERQSIPLNRFLEYTEDYITEQFKLSDNLSFLEKIKKFPCFFMQEGKGNEAVFVGQINNMRIVGRDVIFEYSLDKAAPHLVNGFIYENRNFLHINDYEFSRNHWAVKDVDLYKFLFRTVHIKRQKPAVFQISEYDCIEPAQVSVMMPFGAEFNTVYSAIQSAAAEVGLNCLRADDIWENAVIIQDVVSLIDRSIMIVCDCTGRNPNVFYEIGIAHTLGREVILITQSENDIPFDLRHLRYLRYHGNAQGLYELTRSLQERMQHILGRDS